MSNDKNVGENGLLRIFIVALLGLFLAACGSAGENPLQGVTVGGTPPSPPVTPPATTPPTIPGATTTPGATTPPPSGCSPTVGGPLALAVTAHRTSGQAPLAVFFDATATTATGITRPFHDIAYAWNFGDASVPWSYGSQVGGPGVNDKNLATGAVAAHVFENPGTYTVCLTAFDGTNTAVSEVQITVTDFTAGNTYCLANGAAPVAGAGGCPSGANVAGSVTTWSAVLGNLSANRKVLLKRGDTFTVNADTNFTKTGPAMLGAYGTGNKPLIAQTGGTAFSAVMKLNGVSDIRIVDLNIDGNDGGLFAAMVSDSGTVSNLMLLRIDIRDMAGIEIPLQQVSGVPDGFFLVDSTMDSLSASNNSFNHGILIGSRKVAILGNEFKGFTADADNQHPLRLQYLDRAVVAHNTVQDGNGGKELLSVRGVCSATCDSGSEEFYSAKGLTGAAAATRYVIVSDNIVKTNTYAGIQSTQINPNDATRIHDIIIERNYLPSVSGGGTAIRVQGDAISIRNNVINLTSSQVDARIGIEADAATPGMAAVSNAFIYNNTIYSGATGDFLGVMLNGGTGISVKNNIGYAPSATTTFVMLRNSASGTTIANNTCNTSDCSTGIKTSPIFINGSGSFNALADFKLSGGYALNGGGAVPVYSDLFGVLRPQGAARDIGATEQ